MTAIGIFGGRFDPVHLAHVHIAKAAADSLALKEVRWIVTGRPEYKDVCASTEHRLAMVKLALHESADPRMMADDREIRAAAQGRSNFTAETIAELKRESPDQAFVLIIGEDQLEGFLTWSRWQWIVGQVELAVCARPGVNSAAAIQAIEAAGGTIRWVQVAPSPISSTAVRDAAARGQTLTGLIPGNVARYIETHHLYTSAS